MFGFSVFVAFMGVSETVRIGETDAEIRTGPTVDLFFTGGGVRASMGTFIAACALENYYKSRVTSGKTVFGIDNMYGLSGGSWGVSLMTTAADNNVGPCDLIEKVKQHDNWGATQDFSVTCNRGNGNILGFTWDDCFDAWVKDIGAWFKDVGVDAQQLKRETSKFAFAANTRVRYYVQTDPCWQPNGEGTTPTNDGSCLISFGSENGTLRCAMGKNSKRLLPYLVGKADGMQVQTGPIMKQYWRDSNQADWLGLSSDAYASAGVSTKINPLKPPWIKLTPPLGSQATETEMCDPGAACNIPFASLEILHRSDETNRTTFVVFDFSDNGGDVAKETATCLQHYTEMTDWQLCRHTWNYWGASLLVQRGNVDVKNVPGEKDEFGCFLKPQEKGQILIHIVALRGDTLGDELVKQIPTSDPLHGDIVAPLAQGKSIIMQSEYGTFLKHMLESDVNPFTDTTQNWVQSLIDNGVKGTEFKGDPLKGSSQTYYVQHQNVIARSLH
eukprot:TRINITY_DN69162_c0_g1_i1.p1 TRINITY_DN69162_c0_g1~~TRINITY_DN69162_c0_g1_i1.p1  ORF type:complete len:500 (+),score=59.54 TRINITY_DN69162_c0_g1_i1:63-1562(+)